MFIFLTPTNGDHIPLFHAETLTTIECQESSGLTPHEVVAYSLQLQQETWTAWGIDKTYPDEPILLAFIGCTEAGVPWMLRSSCLTHVLQTHPRARFSMHRFARAFTRRWLAQHGSLQNRVLSINYKEIAWLKSLGFTVEDEVSSHGRVGRGLKRFGMTNV